MIPAAPPAIVAQGAPFAPIPADLATIVLKRAGKTAGGVVIIGRRLGDNVQLSISADPRAGKIDGSTRFEVDGITETVTAMMLAEAVRRDELQLDAPLDALHVTGLHPPAHGGRAITLGDLACHRAGLPALPLSEALQPYAAIDRGGLFARVNEATLARDPGTAFAPSPLDYALLGTLLADRQGTPYAELVRQRVFVPLAMNDTVADEGRDRDLVPGRAIDGRPVAPWRYGALAPAGAMRTTPNDLLRFAGAFFDDDNGPLAQDARLAATSRASAANGEGIGMGWLVDGRSGAIHASGSSYGATSYLAIDPHRHAAVVILTNVGIGFADASFDDVGMRLLAQTGAPR